jgi:pimeloyl-ACP methyl ester carboxylesterase
MAWHGPPGRQLYYEDSGRGDAVVLMPGWGGNIADLGRLRRDLADGFRVVAVDLPGSGRSQPQPRHYTPGYYLAAAVTKPSDALAPLAAYLTAAYGRDNAIIMTETWSSAMRGILEAGGDISRSLAAQIRCPALLVAGTHDEFCLPEQTRELSEAIPRGQFAEAHGAGHDVHLSHGDWLSATALRWLAGH